MASNPMNHLGAKIGALQSVHQKETTRIVLASSSPRRAQLLEQLGLEFTISPADIDEALDHSKSPEEFARDLSWDKAMIVATALKASGEKALVIGADTIVVKGEILGKPKDAEDAFSMLQSLQGGWHNVISGLSVIDSETLEGVKVYEKTAVKMRSISEEEILAYIRTGEPLDKAGSYGIQGMGAVLVKTISGCYFNVVGLPLSRLYSILTDFGLQILK